MCSSIDLLREDYKENKVQENLDAEIFGVVSEEAKEGWDQAGAGG